MHKKFKKRSSLDAILDASLRHLFFYHFQINTDGTVTPLQPLHQKEDFAFRVTYKILVPEGISIEKIITVASMIESLYPKHAYSWESVVCETIKDNAITVCLVETPD